MVRSMEKACSSLLLAISTKEVGFKMKVLAGVIMTSKNALAYSLNVLGIYTQTTGDSYAGDFVNGNKTGHGT